MGGILIPSFFCFAGTEEESGTSVSIPLSPPSSVSATATSSYQVEVSWSSVSGAVSYNVYRGGVNVGSSSSTSFTDTGLSPGTTYSYTVTSVGSGNLESDQSLSVSVTTPPLEEEEGGGGGFFIPPDKPVPNFLFIEEDEEYTRKTEVSLFISADNARQMAVSNGPEFEGVSWEPYTNSKEWILIPGEGEKTVYVKFRSREGGVSGVIEDSIVLDTTSPPNVKDLEALPSDRSIGLNWVNPDLNDFAGVKIMRSELFFPVEPWEGVEVFKGDGTSFTDKDLVNERRYYYTVFAYDKAGNYSSGATVSQIPVAPLPPPPPPPPSEPSCTFWEVEPEKGELPLTVQGEGGFRDPESEVKSTYVDWGDGNITETGTDPAGVSHVYNREGRFTSQLVLVAKDGTEIKSPYCRFTVEVTAPPPPPPPEIERIDLEDFNFSQNGLTLSPREKELRVIAEEPMDFSVEYEVFPESLKTIMVTLKDGERSFSFLLRVNSEKTLYQGSIFPPEEPGVYPVAIHIFDYKNQSVKKIEALLEVIERQHPPYPLPYRILLFLKREKEEIGLILILLLILLFIIRRRRKKNEKRKRKKNTPPR